MKSKAVSPEIIRASQLKQETGLSIATCRRLESDPLSGFPKRIKLTPNGTAVGHLKSQLKEWRESRPIVSSPVSPDATKQPISVQDENRDSNSKSEGGEGS